MRITQKQLEYAVLRLNELTDSPTEYITNKKINVKHFTLSGAYGGWELQRVMNTSGGVNVISRGGHIPKRELYNQIHAIIEGIHIINEVRK